MSPGQIVLCVLGVLYLAVGVAINVLVYQTGKPMNWYASLKVLFLWPFAVSIQRRTFEELPDDDDEPQQPKE